ncbi:Protein NETWORKED 1D [Glycine soja]
MNNDKDFPKVGVSSTASRWPSFNDIKAPPLTYSLSAEEKATVAVLQLQHKVLEACQKFLVGDAGSDGDEDDEDEDKLVDDYDSKECEEYKFFEKVFAEDGDLRRYYESNQKEGDFHCLVCGGIGKKVWKRFKNCKTLIHHSTAILRTKRKRAHRACAQVICKVVGWDIDQLPAIVLKDLDSSLTGSRKLLGFEKESVSLDGKRKLPRFTGVDGTLWQSYQNVIFGAPSKAEESHESLVSGAEWESESPKAGFSSTASGWPSFDDIKSSSLTYSLSAEEKATMAVDEDDEEAEDDELLDNDSKESEEYKFFEKVFAEDGDLRRYYENNHKEGDFYCLVCGGIGNKVWKRFKDCIGLIQHSTAILRTRRKRAHRAYAQVICKVVGWDIDQMPAIVLKDLDSSLAGSRKLFVEPKNPVVGCIDDTNSNDVLPKFARRGLNFFETQEESNEQNSGSNNTLSESEHVTKAETEILALKKAIAKLEDETEAGLLQYQQSLEKMSNLELEVSTAQENSRKLDERASKAEAEVQALKEAQIKLQAESEASLLQYQEKVKKQRTLIFKE